MTRSLLLAASFPPALGGIETLLYQTSRHQADPPLVLAPFPASAPDLNVQAVRLGVAQRLAYRPLWQLHPTLHYIHAFLGPALRACTAAQPDVILAGHVYMAPLARLLKRPYVVYAYGQEVWRGGRPMGIPALDARLRGAALRQACRVLAPGSFTHGLLKGWGVPAERIACVPFGAEPKPAATPPASQGRRLLSVARLVPRKGIDSVIRALRDLDASYHVVGSGPDLPRLRALARECGVADRVSFLGRVDDAALNEEYQRCALFVLPARRTEGELEGYGLVYFEAAAWGRAVVAGRSGGEGDVVVDGVTGVLVDSTSVDDVRSAIASLLNEPGRLRTLGANGRARVETTHNWVHAAAVVDEVLAQL